MVTLVDAVRLAGFAIGALGGVLVFLEFFMEPSYVDYDPDFDSYSLDLSPTTVTEHTWIGRVGGLCVAVGFALQFFAVLVGL